jgi:hypothetical protein
VTDDTGPTGTGSTTATISPVGGEADVFLTRVRAPSALTLRVDRDTERGITVYGGGDTLEQAVTVSLGASVTGSGLEVEIEPASVTQTVVPGNRETRFSFEAEVECEEPGSYEILWTGTIIDAEQNADPTNDTAEAVTTVECRGSSGGKKKGHEDS